jgi:carboxyl-terminal processing protease
MIHQNLIFQYAFDYTDSERASLQHYATVEDFRDNFKVDDRLFNGLLDYARKQGLSFTPKEVSNSEKKIKILLKAYIGRNLLDDAGFYPIYHDVDKIFQVALDKLRKEK